MNFALLSRPDLNGEVSDSSTLSVLSQYNSCLPKSSVIRKQLHKNNNNHLIKSGGNTTINFTAITRSRNKPKLFLLLSGHWEGDDNSVEQ